MVLFGVSNMLSDIYECVNLPGKKITGIVLNVPEWKRERTKDLAARLEELNEQHSITSLEDFIPVDDEEYFVVPTTARKSGLVKYLKNTYKLKFSQMIHPIAYVSPLANIGQDVFIGANSVISPGSIIKDHVFINHAVTVGHDSILHEYVRLNPGCNIAGYVEILDNAIICLGST